MDTNGDAIAEIAYRFTFSPKKDGVQTATVRRASGEQARGASKEGEILFQDVPVAFEGEFRSVESGEYRLRPFRTSPLPIQPSDISFLWKRRLC